MSNTASTARSSDTRRHKLTGDVHLLLLNPEGLVLFGRRHNTGFEDGAWHVPAGHLEASESVVQALIREAKEEVGVTIAPEDVESGMARRRTASRRSAANLPGSRSMLCLTT